MFIPKSFLIFHFLKDPLKKKEKVKNKGIVTVFEG